MSSAAVIVNWNSGNRLRTCIESLVRTSTNTEVLVVDNASEDASIESVEMFRDRVSFIRNSVNRGFAAAINQAFDATTSACVLVLNPDIQVTAGAVRRLEDFMETHPRAGAAGGYVDEKYLPRDFPTVGGIVRENLGLGHRKTVGAVYDRPRSSNCEIAGGHRPSLQVDQPAAAALMVRRDAYEDVGGFDEQFYPAWYEDVDFCKRLKDRGWEIYFIPQAEFLHAGGYSAEALGAEKFARAYYGNQVRYARKHLGPAGAAVVRASIAAGMIGRMLGRP
ncbi:MAG: glycosyltransferase family 2 protein, partial [Acidobacteria bacterium]|nr:glycosyltransferase family 2 protein [Acidobacteriota bacterium]